MDDPQKELDALERLLVDANAEPIPLSYACLRKITNDFTQEIGHGGFGVVYMGNLQNGKVAVKKLSQAFDFSEKQFEDELLCLIRVKHKNIVRFLGYCSDTSKQAVQHNGEYVMAEVRQRFLCFDYVPKKSLKEYLKDKSYRREWDTTYQLIEGICHGLRYLHNKERINHLDLKPENVLLDADMVPKITDFGLSRRFGQQSRIFTKYIRGTPGYIAPEYLDNGEISFKTDIYSLGIIIIKVLRGGNDLSDFENWHKSLVIDNLQVKRCVEIARLCVDADQHKRPTIDEIIGMLNQKETVIEMVSPVLGHSRSNSRSSLEQTEGQETQPPVSAGNAAEERLSAESRSKSRTEQESDRESASASCNKPLPASANKEAEDTATHESFFRRGESGSGQQSIELRQVERVATKEMAENCFGEVVDDYKLDELVRYVGKSKTQEDRARRAWRLMNEDDKKGKASRYVDVLKKVYGNGQSTLCLVYNAIGDTLYYVANHDWYGYIGSKVGYPAEIGNGQWAAFHHVHRQGEPSGSVGAVVYRGKKKDGQDGDYLVAWSTPWGFYFRNKAYGEISGVDYFQRRWDEIYVKLVNSDYSSNTKSGGCEIEAHIDKGDSPKFIATIKAEHGP